MHAPAKAITPKARRRNGAGTAADGITATRGLPDGLLSRRQGATAPYRVALPWEDFAQAWSRAEERLARLEQQLSSSDLRHCWICRSDFEEAAALAALHGDPVAMEDLVMVDAGAMPTRPTTAWWLARAMLSLRRHVSRAGPAKVLSIDGVLTLEALLENSLGNSLASGEATVVDSGAVPSDRRRKIERWLGVVEDLRSTPPLPAAAIALRVWRRLAPLAGHNDQIGLILAATLLWSWGKTKGLTACPATGFLNEDPARDDLGTTGRQFHDRAPLGRWIAHFCAAIESAAERGQIGLTSVVQGRARMSRLATRHRVNSRLPRLAWLFLAYPVIPAQFITRRLQLTPQGSDWLIKELIQENVVMSATDEAKCRVYSLRL